MDNLAIFAGKVVSWISRVLGWGAGATWPGEIALRVSPRILSKLLSIPRKGVIIVAGTNGKTTTASMIVHVLQTKHVTVIRNESGANLVNGIVSSLIAAPKNVDYAVFEVDENALPQIIGQVAIDPLRLRSQLRSASEASSKQSVYLVLLNLFRDQLDRYGEVDAIAEHWKKALSKLPPQAEVILNADDPQIAFLGKGLRTRTTYFGLSEKKHSLAEKDHATDSIFCPSCGKRLLYDTIYFSHLGEWHCESCGFSHPQNSLTARDVSSPLEGVYNVYNTLAATAVGMRNGISPKESTHRLSTFTPAFGRMEEIIFHGKKVKVLLSKNPTGFNESIRTMLAAKQKGPLMVLLNDRIPDGRDVSWIWDVDFEKLESYDRPIVISGDRALDMGVRLKYASKFLISKSKILNIILNLNKAVNTALELTKNDDTLWILATYSAMLDVRKILTGKKIL